MRYETIESGSVNNEYDVANLEIIKVVILSTCGEPPAGCFFDLRLNDHDCGEYYELCLCWEYEETIYHNYLENAMECFHALNDNLDWQGLWDAFPSDNWIANTYPEELDA